MFHVIELLKNAWTELKSRVSTLEERIKEQEQKLKSLYSERSMVQEQVDQIGGHLETLQQMPVVIANQADAAQVEPADQPATAANEEPEPKTYAWDRPAQAPLPDPNPGATEAGVTDPMPTGVLVDDSPVDMSNVPAETKEEAEAPAEDGAVYDKSPTI